MSAGGEISLQRLNLSTLPDPGSTTLEVEHAGCLINILIVQKEGEVHGYLNHCPHLGTPLDWIPGEVLDRDGTYITCATHGALFLIDSGYCVSGPCAGESLRNLPLKVRDGQAFLNLDLLETAQCRGYP